MAVVGSGFAKFAAETLVQLIQKTGRESVRNADTYFDVRIRVVSEGRAELAVTIGRSNADRPPGRDELVPEPYWFCKTAASGRNPICSPFEPAGRLECDACALMHYNC